MQTTFIDDSVDAGIATITLQRPEAATPWRSRCSTTSTRRGAEAEQAGTVTEVVPVEDPRAEARALAVEVAQKHPFALRQAERAVNQTLDVQGFYAAIQSVFDVHQTGHGHALSESGLPILMLLDGMKTEIKKPASSADRS